MVVINGKAVEGLEGRSILDYVLVQGFNPRCVVAELNRLVVSFDRFESEVIKDGDVLEILNFVGGG